MSKLSKEQKEKVNGAFSKIKNGNASSEDASTVIDNAEDILRKSADGPLGNFFEDIKSMIEMVKAWCKKEYKGIPFRTISMVILSLLYVFIPVDIIPDVIPVVGLLDDAAVIGLCLKAMKDDLDDFRAWQKENN